MNRMNKKQLMLLTAGLLVTSLAFVISRFTPLSDGLHGFIVGAGIGLEIVALISFRKGQRSKGPNQCHHGI